MNRQQIAQIYDSMTPEQQNMPRTEFIRQTMNAINPNANKQILSTMIEQKHQKRVGEIRRTQIGAALRRGK